MIFKNKKYFALILGASGGIGLATAKKLAEEGMNLCIVYRDRKADARVTETFYEELAAKHEIEVLTLNADAADIETIKEICQKLYVFKSRGFFVRLLLHSVSKGNLKPLVKTKERNRDFSKDALGQSYKVLDEEKKKFISDEFLLDSSDFQLTLQQMALSLIDWVKILHENELFADDARIIGLSSEGNQKAWVNYAAVSATKAALEAIVRSIALEYAPYGIRANIIQAGVTDTSSLRRIPGADYLKTGALFRNPMGRLTKPEDVANAVYLLCRDEAAWINGALIKVDGGESIC